MKSKKEILMVGIGIPLTILWVCILCWAITFGYDNNIVVPEMFRFMEVSHNFLVNLPAIGYFLIIVCICIFVVLNGLLISFPLIILSFLIYKPSFSSIKSKLINKKQK